MKTFAVATALLATAVTAIPLPNRHLPCGSKAASKSVLLDLSPAENTPENQQYFESPRLDKPLQVAVTINFAPYNDGLSEVEEERSLGMHSRSVLLLSMCSDIARTLRC